MRFFYLFVLIAVPLTILAVWFVPGADDLVEQIFQQLLGRAAR